MEQWDAEKKMMTRHTIDRVAEATNSLVLLERRRQSPDAEGLAA
ncbi:Uncharacterised protein [Escherichia coli]|nr:hypothetical protein [Escherichia coli]STJ03363.1 Uncharacterised protein [Escherichia coli]